ncbi:MAG: RdgB/HAM1 family non-canonical purine NTP pyrophosphatase [Methyloligellaceae bacterium]
MAPARLARGDRLIVASHNPGKVREIEELLAPYGVAAVSAGSLDLPEPEETGTTFAANAELKAVAACAASGSPALADDSGLEVAALDGAPGIYSARWAGAGKDFGEAMARVERELVERGAKTPEARGANFTCALTIAWPGGRHATYEGKVFGHLVWPPRGNYGFGYDPMFVPEGHTQTFGEMEPAQKHGMSHRARAFELFVRAVLEDGASGEP